MDNSSLPPAIEPSGSLHAIFPIIKFIAFPKTIVPLHIFENRYQQMLTDLNSSSEEKLVVLTNLNYITQSPLDIGVLSKIISQEMLENGRSNILVECIERVKILDYFRPYSNNEYAIGEIKSFPEEKIVMSNQEWEVLFPELLSAFKNHFKFATGKKFVDYSNNRLKELSSEEIINTICQFSYIDIKKKIDLLKTESLLLHAKILKETLELSILP